MSKIPPELRETAAKAIGIERQEVGCRKFGHDGAESDAYAEIWQECLLPRGWSFCDGFADARKQQPRKAGGRCRKSLP